MNLFGFRKQAMEVPVQPTSSSSFNKLLPSMLSKLNGLLIIHLNSILTQYDEDVGKTFYVFNNNLNYYQFPISGKLQFDMNPENKGEAKISSGKNIYRIKHDRMNSTTTYDVSAGDRLYIELLDDYDKLIPLFIEMKISYPIINNNNA